VTDRFKGQRLLYSVTDRDRQCTNINHSVTHCDQYYSNSYYSITYRNTYNIKDFCKIRSERNVEIYEGWNWNPLVPPPPPPPFPERLWPTTWKIVIVSDTLIHIASKAISDRDWYRIDDHHRPWPTHSRRLLLTVADTPLETIRDDDWHSMKTHHGSPLKQYWRSSQTVTDTGKKTVTGHGWHNIDVHYRLRAIYYEKLL
jgi:hypothetical protein